jgi:hypothetical protein
MLVLQFFKIELKTKDKKAVSDIGLYCFLNAKKRPVGANSNER